MSEWEHRLRISSRPFFAKVLVNLAMSRAILPLLLNNPIMARKTQNQNIDALIHNVNAISQNRCSLSDEDVKIL